MIEKVLEYFRSKKVRCKIIRDSRPDYGDFIAVFGYGELTREKITEKISENKLLCMFFETSIREDLYNRNNKLNWHLTEEGVINY